MQRYRILVQLMGNEDVELIPIRDTGGDWIKHEDYLIDKDIRDVIIRELKSVIADLTKEMLNRRIK